MCLESLKEYLIKFKKNDQKSAYKVALLGYFLVSLILFTLSSNSTWNSYFFIIILTFLIK